MDAKAKEKSSGPLGILGCITAGFEIVGHNLWPLAIPLLLDLFLWLGPQLSVAPLVEWFIRFSKQANPAIDPHIVQMMEQFGAQFNLFSLCSANQAMVSMQDTLTSAPLTLFSLLMLFALQMVNFMTLPLLNTPSLLAHHASEAVSPLGEHSVFPIDNVLVLTAWTLVLIPIGLLLGFAYLNSLANSVRAFRPEEADTAPSKTTTERSAASQGLRTAIKLIRILLFATILIGGSMLFLPIWIALIASAIGLRELVGLVIGGLGTGLIAFIMLHLLFVVHGVLLGERRLPRAILDSIMLIRTEFLSSVGLVMLGLLIYNGLGLIWSLPPNNSWLLLIGIVGHSCIATGLLASTFVFYRERIEMLTPAPPQSAETA